MVHDSKNKVISVAPGKIILTGEHSVVYGKPALLTAINREVRVEIEKGEKKFATWQLDYGEIGPHKESIKTLIGYWREAYKAWSQYMQTGKSELWQKFSKDPLVVVKASLGLFYAQIDSQAGVEITINSTIPAGSGMGSSAAVGAAILGGLAEHLALGWSRDKLFEEAYKVEQIAHGRASGADPAAVVYGGCLEFQKTGEEKYFKPQTLPRYEGAICLIDTGKPTETTGEMVSKINYQLSIDNDQIKNTIEKMGQLSQKVIDKVKIGKFDWEWVEENERLLEELGVVGERAKIIVERLRKLDVRAKVCGAGGIKTGSGIVLAYQEERDRLEYAVGQMGLPYYQVSLGVPGWRIG